MDYSSKVIRCTKGEQMWVYSDIDDFYVNLEYMEMAFVEGEKDMFILFIESSDKIYRIKEFAEEKQALRYLHEIFIPVSLHATSSECAHTPVETCQDSPKRTRKSPKKARSTRKKVQT